MISFKQYLSEARMAPLYHGTSIHSLKSIIQNNVIRHGWDDGTVSLSRNFKFAKNWAIDRYNSGNGWVVIEFDQQKLTHRYKIKPFHFHGSYFGSPTRYLPSKAVAGPNEDDAGIDRNQFEEALVGDIVGPLKYITAIYVSDVGLVALKKGSPAIYKKIKDLIKK